MDILINNMDENMSYEKSCGAVVYKTSNKGIQYLLLKSIGIDGYWGFPKGHMEYSETEEETALREVFEECGLKVNLIDGFRVTDKYIIDNLIEKEVVLFLGEADNSLTKIQVEEIENYRWSDYEEAKSLLTFDSGRRILSEANRFLCERFK
ncbi:bis(5'-nucleosyl)-tetraphosphatase [Clostridium sp.]|uniref:bis(5'-nucleosyl)-tetraphosphatase n=1 Tax=Clostridium sp. TaxID=1506 RepID=UPI003463B730